MAIKSTTTGVVAAVLASVALLSPCAVRAEEAQDLYQQGIEQFEQGSYKDAAESFRKAYSLKASWKMHYNIGQSEAAAHRYGLALDAFETYLVQGGDDISVERREAVLAEIQRLRLLVGVVELEAAPGSELLIDGTTRGTVPFPGTVRVAAGEHDIVVRKDGEELLTKHVKIAGGMTTKIDAREATGMAAEPPAAGEQPAAAPASAPAEDEPPRGKLIAGSVLGGLGLVGIGIGAAFTVKGNADNNDYQDAVDIWEENRTDENKRQADNIWNNRVTVDRAMMIVGYGVGGALLIAGTVLIILDVKQHGEQEEEDSAVALSVSPTGVGLSF